MIDYKTLIIKWHKKAVVEDDPFSCFIFQYLAFIALISKYAYSSCSTDREVIDNLKRDSKIKSKYLESLVIGDVEDAWDAISEELNTRPLGLGNLGNRDVRENSHWDVQNGNHSGVIRNTEDWANMVECVYSIRINLFHGSKNPDNKRDQLLITNGQLVLKPLVEILINEYLQ